MPASECLWRIAFFFPPLILSHDRDAVSIALKTKGRPGENTSGSRHSMRTRCKVACPRLDPGRGATRTGDNSSRQLKLPNPIRNLILKRGFLEQNSFSLDIYLLNL